MESRIGRIQLRVDFLGREGQVLAGRDAELRLRTRCPGNAWCLGHGVGGRLGFLGSGVLICNEKAR
jgi:hypothetical protein